VRARKCQPAAESRPAGTFNPATWVERMAARGYTFELLGENWLCIGIENAKPGDDLSLWREYHDFGTAGIKAFLRTDAGTPFLVQRPS
jgi:hypothetical protein